MSKPVLAVDSALGGCIAGILTPSGGEFARILPTQRDQAARLVPMVQSLMEEAGVGFADLGLIVTTIGPGSFTGLRIGLSTARALGMSLRVPVQGVGTLDVMARSCNFKNNILAVLETKREDYYVQLFDCNFKSLSDAVCMKSSEISAIAKGKNFLLCTDVATRLKEELGAEGFRTLFAAVQERELLDPVLLAKIGLEYFQKNGQKAVKPEPVYLRRADVSVSNKIQREIQDFPS